MNNWKKIAKSIFVTLLFGLTSLLFCKIHFTIPGSPEAISDLREVILLIGMIFSPHWSHTILLGAITAIGTPNGGSVLTTAAMHCIGLLFSWFFYHKYIVKIKNTTKIIISWVVLLLIYYYILVLPILVIGYWLSNVVTTHNLVSFAKSLAKTTQYEIVTTLMVTTLFTITKFYQDKVTDEKEKLKISLQSIPDAVITINLDGKIEFANNTAINLLNLNNQNEQLINLSVFNIFKDISAKKERNLNTSIKHVLNSKATIEQFSPISLNNKLITETIAPIFNKNKDLIGAIIILKDVTEKVEIEEQLAHANKMDAIGQLAGGVAHDFNNMLSGIINAAQLLTTTINNISSKEKKYIDLILNASSRAAELTSKLLAFGRKGKLISTAIDVHNVIKDTLAIVSRTIDKKIIITTELKAENPMTIGDNSELQNAFINLCINASHAMPNGGELYIGTRNIFLSEKYCNKCIFELLPGDYIEIEIKDTGCGIPKENLEKIFDPFFTTKEQGKGTGLGLAAVYGTVINHHGEIHVYSEEEIGTSFKILLPCTTKKSHTSKVEKTLIKGSGHILLVDDEELIRITGKDMLEYMGYKVITAQNGKEAIDLYIQNQNQIDLIIMDMIMPIMSGKEAFYKIKKINPHCKIIISSGFAKKEQLNLLNSKGLNGFISKPFRDYELSKVVSQVIKN
jgi:nitrogen-specific signal transduction histidine kinase/CheY-like chemotaxis protein